MSEQNTDSTSVTEAVASDVQQQTPDSGVTTSVDEKSPTQTTDLAPSDKIEKAVQFLSNPNVQKSSQSSRVAFLEHKGLTADEIAEAFKLAYGTKLGDTATRAKLPPNRVPRIATAVNRTGQKLPQPPTPYPRPQQLALVQQKRGFMDSIQRYTWKDVFIGSVLAGGLTAGIYWLIKTYVVPFFTRMGLARKMKQEQKSQILSQLQEMRLEMDSLRKSVDGIDSEIKQHSIDKDALTTSISVLRQDMNQVISSTQELPNKFNQSISQVTLKHTNSLVELKTDNTRLKALLRDAERKVQQLSAPNITANSPDSQVGSTVPSFANLNPSAVESTSDQYSATAGNATPITTTPTTTTTTTAPITTNPSIPAWQQEAMNRINSQKSLKANNTTTTSTEPTNDVDQVATTEDAIVTENQE